MKRFLFALSLLSCAAAVYSVPVDVAVQVEGGNQSFQADRASSVTVLPTESYFFGGDTSVAIGLSETLRLAVEYERHSILGNLARLAFRHEDQFASVSAGAVFGVANTQAVLLKPGVYTSIRFDIAGLLYARFLSERSLRVDTRRTGDYVVDSLGLATGFYLPNAILTLRYISETRREQTDSGAVVDTETDYRVDVDAFAKNVPYRVLLSFGYRDVARTYPATRHTMGLLILGTSVEADFGDALTYRVGVDSSVYTFGRDALIGEYANDRYVFRARMGVSYSIGR